MERITFREKILFYLFVTILGVSLVAPRLYAQLQSSAPGGINVQSINGVTPVMGNGNTSAGSQRVTIAADNTAFSVNATLTAGALLLGRIRVDHGCALATPFLSQTVGVAGGAGTSVTSTTTCVTKVYINNITNSAVTFRLADKTAITPVIWVGGNADFNIPANSNLTVPLEGTSFTSGITAIAGTASALNLFISGLQ